MTEKARIVAESLVPGARVSEVARKYGVTRWQVYDWRKRYGGQARRMLPDDGMAAAMDFAALVVEEPAQDKAARRCIEIVVGDAVIRAKHDVDTGHLSRVIRAVRAAR